MDRGSSFQPVLEDITSMEEDDPEPECRRRKLKAKRHKKRERQSISPQPYSDLDDSYGQGSSARPPGDLDMRYSKPKKKHKRIRRSGSKDESPPPPEPLPPSPRYWSRDTHPAFEPNMYDEPGDWRYSRSPAPDSYSQRESSQQRRQFKEDIYDSGYQDDGRERHRSKGYSESRDQDYRPNTGKYYSRDGGERCSDDHCLEHRDRLMDAYEENLYRKQSRHSSIQPRTDDPYTQRRDYYDSYKRASAVPEELDYRCVPRGREQSYQERAMSERRRPAGDTYGRCSSVVVRPASREFRSPAPREERRPPPREFRNPPSPPREFRSPPPRERERRNPSVASAVVRSHAVARQFSNPPVERERPARYSHSGGYTGYHHFSEKPVSPPSRVSEHREKSRRRSSPQLTMADRPSPPRDMPEHIRWLHDRWKKYDQTFFEKKKHAGGNASHKSDPRSREDFQEYRRLRTDPQPAPDRERSRSRAPSTARSHHGGDNQNQGGGNFARPFFEYRKWQRGDTETWRMMSFKEYLMSLPNDIEDHAEAVKQYNDYKVQFRKDAIQSFFDAHKRDEWFREKYHPVIKQQKEFRKTQEVRTRLDVFMTLLVQGWVEIGLDYSNAREIKRTLDAAAVLFEGGTLSELRALAEYDYTPEEKKEEEYERKKAEEESGVPSTDVQEKKKLDATQLEIMQHSRDYSAVIKDQDDEPDIIEQETTLDEGEISEPPKYVGGGIFIAKAKAEVAAKKIMGNVQLHNYTAVQIKNLPPTVSRAELENLCARAHQGFLRLSMSQPKVDHRYYRDAIATFVHNANIDKVAWKLRTFRLRGSNLLALEYKDWTKRVHCVDGLALDKSVVLRDIQLAKSLIQFLDKKYELWTRLPDKPDTAETAPEEGEAADDMSKEPCDAVEKVNPLLINLDECLEYHMNQLIENEQRKKEDQKWKPCFKEEGEEDDDEAEIADPLIESVAPELPSGPDGAPVPVPPPSKKKSSKKTVERDEQLAKILDRLLLYLRIVHSVDFYGCKYYENEDNEPRRCGIMHVRGVPVRPATPKNLTEYIQKAEEGLKALFPNETRLNEEHMELLGKRDAKEAVKEFSRNALMTVSEGLEKCTICYKRFTNLHFGKQHVNEKHSEKFKDVELEVNFFNNYLGDPNRPCSAKFA